MFRSKKRPESVASGRASSTASPRPHSVASTGAGNAPRSQHVSATAPMSERLQPQQHVGIARLLEVYDDYPHLVAELESLTAQLHTAEDERAHAEHRRSEMAEVLKKEKEGRTADAETAEKEKAAALKLAKEEKLAAEEAREKKIRGELDPRIKTLEEKLKTTETERDKWKNESEVRRRKMEGWISSMEKLDKERNEVDAREAKAAEERKAVDVKLRELDKSILEGLRESTKPTEEPEEAATTTSTTTKPASTTPFGKT